MKNLSKLVIMLLTVSFTLTSCDSTIISSSAHEHTFASFWVTNDEYHWHPSTCGHDVKGDKERHNFTSVVTDPTYEEGGYTTYTCSVCGYSYTDNETDKLEHNYSSTWSYDEDTHWHACIDEGYEHLRADEESHSYVTSVTDPTYEEGGYTTYTCSVCGYSYTDNETDKLYLTVTWKNYDGTVLEVDNDVSYGTTPTYDGEEPTKESDDRYDYYFAGWTPEVGPVIKDTTYTAVFSNEEITYTIDFDLNGGASSSYKGPIEVTSFSKDIFFFDCVKEDWQFRGWEYNGEKIFDEKGNQLKNVTLVDNMIFRAIYSQTVKLTITTNMPEAGTITGEGEYPYNTYVDVSVTPNQGYKFVGWYYQNTLLSNEENYKYMMWDKDITLEARFERDDFNLRIYSNNEDYGLVLLKSNSVIDDYLPEYTSLREYGSEVTIAAYSKSDVRFLGWYDENNVLVTTNAVYTFVMPNYDYTLEAKWNYFTINYNLNGGVNNPNNPSYYTTDDGNIHLQDPTKEGYEFVAWKYNDEIIDIIDVNLVQDITLEAIWSDYEYEIREDDNGKYAVIIGYDDSITDAIIPKNVILDGEEIPVKEISQTAFKDNQKVKSVTVSNKVTTIDEYAFAGCTSLESIYIPDNVATIGDYAFSGCSSLTSIYIPNSVTTIGDYAFRNCSNLTIYCEVDTKQEGWSNYWNDSNRPVIWNSYKGIYGDFNGLEYIAYHDNDGNSYITITGYNGSNTDVVIPEYIEVNGEQIVVKEILNTAFRNNTKITSINIPNGVTSIADNTFEGCSNLTTVTISENSQLTTIEDHAFYGCSSLTSIYIPDSVTTIGSYAFYKCSSLTSIYIPCSVTSIGYVAFHNCSNLTIYCEVSSKPSNWDSSWNSSGRPVVWSSNEEHGEYNGFTYGVSIDNEGKPYITITGYTGSSTNVVIPSLINVNGEDISVKAIASKAFYNNDAITSITIPDSVTTINSYTFYSCSKLTTVTFGENSQLTTIGFEAFEDCSSLTSIYIPDSVTTIEGYAFRNCSNLTIYCEVSSKPSNWDSSWNSSGRPVVWSSNEEHGEYNGFTYGVSIDNEENPYITIAGYTGSSSNIVIPSSINVDGEDISVKVIADNAFYDNDTITSVTIPNSVTTIGSRAFYNCSNLETVTISETSQLTTIGDYAFLGCSSLTSIYIPDSVTTIGDSAFSGCSNLETVTISENSQLTSIGSYAFSSCSSLTSIYIPSGVTSISEYAFRSCSNLTTVTIGEDSQLTTIEQYAFSNCSSLVSFDIPDSVTTIDSYVFYNCSILTTVTISENSQLTTIDAGAFYNCSSLTSIYIPDSVTTIGFRAFYNCSNLKTVTIGENSQLTTIGDYAFYYCSSLTSIYIPNSVTTIGSYAFYYCSNLESITIGEDSQLTTIEDHAFYGCSSLTSIYIPSSVTTIGDSAFYNCSNLTIFCEISSEPSGWSSSWNDSNRPVVWNSYKGIHGNFNGLEYIAYHDNGGNFYIVITGYNGSNTDIVIPEYIEVNGEQIVVKTIADNSFNNDTITSITIPDSVTAIGDYAFYNCSNLITVTIGENSQLTSIGSEAFFYCSSLTSIYIPDNVTSIGYRAFYNCYNLATATIGENSQLTSIGSYAFYNCSSLTSIYIPDSVTAIGDYAFYNCSNLITVTIGENSQLTTIGGSTFYNCSSLTSIYIPDSVTSIGYRAFYGCSNLTIYCEASSEPSGWSSSWNDTNCPVVWNTTYDDYLAAIAQ